MSKIKTYKYRLYPTKKQTEKLNWTLEQCRILYNSCLVDRKNHYTSTKKGLSRTKQQDILKIDKKVLPFLYDIHSQVLQDVLFRVDKAYKAFFRRLKGKNGKAGYPRFKPEERYDSITYPQEPGFTVEDKGKYSGLKLSKIGTVKLKKHRDYKGEIKTCIIKKQSDKWYACISVKCDPSVPKKTVIQTSKVIGLDMGLNTFAVCSDGTEITTDKRYRNSEKKLAETQKKLSREKKGSVNRKKAKISLSKIHNKIANQRKDALHKESTKLIKTNPDGIGVEDLKIRNMVKNHYLSKSINDSGWGQFLSYLKYKAEEAGILFMKVNPRNTSQECICGASVPKKLSDRIHSCPSCGLIAPRDFVSALIIKKRAIKILSERQEYNVSPYSTGVYRGFYPLTFTLVETGSVDDIVYSDIYALKSTPSLKQEVEQSSFRVVSNLPEAPSVRAE